MTENDFREHLRLGGYPAPELIERVPDTHNPEHAHDFDVAALIVEGELRVTTADGTTTCRAGDLFELASGIVHSELYGPSGAKVLVGRRARAVNNTQ